MTEQQRSSRPILNATLRAAATWLFFRPAAAYLHQHEEMHLLRYGGTLCPGGTVESSLAGTAGVVVMWVRVPEERLNFFRHRLNRWLRVNQGSNVPPGRVRYITITRQLLPGYSQQSLRDKEAARY
jgi:hypothetical protein